MKVPKFRKCDFEEKLKDKLYDEFKNHNKVKVSLHYYGNPEVDRYVILRDPKDIWVSVRRAADLIMDSCVEEFTYEPVYQ